MRVQKNGNSVNMQQTEFKNGRKKKEKKKKEKKRGGYNEDLG